MSRPQETAASGPRRLGATTQEAQSGAARPQWEHVSVGCEHLLRDDPGHRVEEAQRRHFRGSAALDPWPRMRQRRKTSVSQLQDAHEPAETCDARCAGREDEFDCAGALRELLQKEIAPLRVQLGPTESAHGFGDTLSCPFCPWRQGMSAHAPDAPPRARKAFRKQWRQAAARRDGPFISVTSSVADALRTTWRDPPSLPDAPSGRCRAPVACESIGSTGCYSRRPVRGSCAKTDT